MKRKSVNGRTSRTTGVSLTPDQEDFLRTRVDKAGITISKYFQSFLEYDREKNILPQALTFALKA